MSSSTRVAPDERQMLKVNAHPLAAGSVVDLKTGGGGGYGDPASATRSAFAPTCSTGTSAARRRERDYGVVLDDALAVDVAATAELRASRREQ